jgi:ubiquinone biosynthesis protein
VAVKVLRPGIAASAERDLDIVLRLAVTLEQRTGWARRLGAVRLAEGFAAALREELDFRVEARNMTAAAASWSQGPDRPGGVAVLLPAAHLALSTRQVLVTDWLDGVSLAAAQPLIAELGLDRAELARTLLRHVLHQITVDGVFHADPHPGNILLLTDGRLGLLDLGSVGRLDALLRSALQDLLLAVGRGDPAGMSDALLDLVSRPDEIDEQALQRGLGQFMALHLAGGAAGAEMFIGLGIPPEVAAVFRALATLEGTLTQLAPGFDLVTEAQGFAQGFFAERLAPDQLRKTATDELVALLPVLRRLPRRIDRVSSALEEGRLGINVRLFADRRDRTVITGLVHQALLTLLGAVTGVIAAILLVSHGGPQVTQGISLFQLVGYNLLVVAAVLALRVLFTIFRADRQLRRKQPGAAAVCAGRRAGLESPRFCLCRPGLAGTRGRGARLACPRDGEASPAPRSFSVVQLLVVRLRAAAERCALVAVFSASAATSPALAAVSSAFCAAVFSVRSTNCSAFFGALLSVSVHGWA